MAEVELVTVGGASKANHIKLQLPVTLGRGRSAGLTLPHPLVSRKHCELFERNGVLCVRDLGSLNGTYVGDRRVIEMEVPEGELLTIGSVTFRVSLLSQETAPTEVRTEVDDVDDTAGKTRSLSLAEVRQVSDTSDFPMGDDDEIEPPNTMERRTDSSGCAASDGSSDDLRTFLDGFV